MLEREAVEGNEDERRSVRKTRTVVETIESARLGMSHELGQKRRAYALCLLWRSLLSVSRHSGATAGTRCAHVPMAVTASAENVSSSSSTYVCAVQRVRG